MEIREQGHRLLFLYRYPRRVCEVSMDQLFGKYETTTDVYNGRPSACS